MAMHRLQQFQLQLPESIQKCQTKQVMFQLLIDCALSYNYY